MTMIIEIDHKEVTTKRVNSTKGEFTVYEQIGWVRTTGERYPQKCKLQRPDAESGYAPGYYEIDPSSLFVDRFGNVQLKKALVLGKTSVDESTSD